MSLLEISGLSVGYGGVNVVRDLSLHVEAGESVALVGANAAGKTTLLRAISGIVRPTAGSIRFAGTELVGATPEAICRAGIAQVAEGRQLFPDMSVRENLELGAMARPEAWAARAQSIERAIALFPRVGERLAQRAGTMSGGEQQQVAIARALMARPRLLLMQNVPLSLRLAQRAYVIELGAVVLEGSGAALLADPHVQAAYLGRA